MCAGELVAHVVVNPVLGGEDGQHIVVVAVEEHLGVGLGGLFAGNVGQRRIPEVARQNFVGPLPGLHHLYRFADLF